MFRHWRAVLAAVFIVLFPAVFTCLKIKLKKIDADRIEAHVVVYYLDSLDKIISWVRVLKYIKDENKSNTNKIFKELVALELICGILG